MAHIMITFTEHLFEDGGVCGIKDTYWKALTSGLLLDVKRVWDDDVDEDKTRADDSPLSPVIMFTGEFTEIVQLVSRLTHDHGKQVKLLMTAYED